MFLDNKYTALYYRIIHRYATEHGEKHHIIPRSFGGSNLPKNLVTVPPRVHFILHRLLVKMVPSGPHHTAMHYALFMMMNRRISTFTSRTYEASKVAVSHHMVTNNPMFREEVLSKRRGQKRSDATKEKIRVANKKRWESTARMLRDFNCPICGTPIQTRVPSQTACSKSCSATLQHRERRAR